VGGIHQDRTGELAAPVSARIYEGRVARVHPDGDPLRYAWGDEYRDAVGLAEIAVGLKQGVAFTLLHPADLVAAGAPADVVGQVIDARIDGDFVVARILITDPRAIAAIKGGIHELSLGYTSRLDANRRQRDIKIDHLALVPQARCGASCALRTDSATTECTCNTRSISYNTNIVEVSASGDIAKYELPSNMFSASQGMCVPLENEGHVSYAMTHFPQMDFKGPAERKAAFHHIVARAHQLGMDPVEFQKTQLDQGHIVMDELQKKLGETLAAMAAEKARADQLGIDLAAAKSALTTLDIVATNAQAALSAEKKLSEAALARVEQAKADAATEIAKAKLDSTAAITGAVAARVQLLTEANEILGAKDEKGQTTDRSAMDDQAIRLAVIKHVDNLEFAHDKDPVFVQGVYAGSLARAATASASRAAIRTTTAQVRAGAARIVQQPSVSAARDAEMAAKQAMQDDQAKRWRTKSN
jgi:hypothetical protein